MELIASGSDIHVSVRRGCLTIKDGRGTRTIERVPSGVYDRLVINGHKGVMTLEAMAWCQDYGMSWTVLYRDRGAIASNTGAVGNAKTLRQQAQAEKAEHVTRVLLAEKINGQADNAETLLRDPDRAKRIRAHADTLMVTPHLTTPEGHAAHIYWNAWKTRVHVPWTVDDMLKVPDRWLRFDKRKSLYWLDKNRCATDPVNALLNYSYQVGLSKCVEACHAVGMSPLIGMSHGRYKKMSQEQQPAMALDLLEPLRPRLDRIVLDLLDYGQGITPYLVWYDFLELSTGVVRVESAEIRERIITGVEALTDDALFWATRVRDML